MKRTKRHKIKQEKPETSSALNKIAEEHDLAYYIHDRVDLMHQVFSVLKHKDLKAMAPACVRRLSIDDLQELCTEELLGISSKRLLAILDGAEPPSDTESSSQSSSHLEAISLDSISSDEELLSISSKKKHKHKHRDSKSKKQKKQKKTTAAPAEDKEQTKASRAGLTVLELLELQARARAIRAQLQQEQAKRSSVQVETTAIESSQHSSDSEIEIKEEAAEVVILSSSDDEKPDVKELEKAATTSKEKIVENDTANNKTTENGNTDATQTTATNENQNPSKKTKKKKEKCKKRDKEKNNQTKEPTAGKESEKTKDPTPAKEQTVQQEQNMSDDVIQVDSVEQSNSAERSNKITKRVNDLIITVPQHSSRKIKLNRHKMTVSISNTTASASPSVENVRPNSVVTIPEKPTENVKKVCSVVSRPKTNETVKTTTTDSGNNATIKSTVNSMNETEKTKSKDKTKKKKKEKRQSVDDDDHDEITLQLSETEKMDLLEDFDRKDYERVSSSSSDSESSSDDSSDESTQDTHDTSKKDTTQDNATIVEEESQNAFDSKINKEEGEDDYIDKNNVNLVENATQSAISEKEQRLETSTEVNVTTSQQSPGIESLMEETGVKNNVEIETIETTAVNKSLIPVDGNIVMRNEQEKPIEISDINDIPLQNASDQESQENSNVNKICNDSSEMQDDVIGSEKEANISAAGDSCVTALNEDSKESNKVSEDGEVSDAESSEVEAFEIQQEVVCISDEEIPKKKKKKDKKSKKEKKKKKDFREDADQNFYKDTDKLKKSEIGDQKPIELDIEDDNDDDDVYEILELSDDSSCYEVEGITLSKEPTDEEIAALSAKIDEIGEIERVSIITEQEIKEHERSKAEKDKTNKTNVDTEDIENISWKDRYLDSNKVKKVLTTSNILNALRNKNKKLKKKIAESKKKELEAELQKQKEIEEQKEQDAHVEKNLVEGSMEQYNTLVGSTKYVDPVPDPIELAKKKADELQQQEEELKQKMLEENLKETQAIQQQEHVVQKAIEEQVTGEMKKDAKLLLKMYKKLLKYNDVTKSNEKEPKKKKNKKKKKKEKDGVIVSTNT